MRSFIRDFLEHMGHERVHLIVDHEEIARCPPDEWLLVEVWDES